MGAGHSRGWALVTAGSVSGSAAPELLNTSANTMESMAAAVVLGLLLVGCGIGYCGAMYYVKRKQAGLDGSRPLMGGSESKPMEMGSLEGKNTDASL